MKTDKKVCYFLFSLAFWSRFAIKNYIFFTRRAFTTMYHYASRSVLIVAHSLTCPSLTCPPFSGPHLFRFLFGLLWSFLVLFCYSSLFFALSSPCNPLFPWPCNPLFSSLGGFIPGMELPPIFSLFFLISSVFLLSSFLLLFLCLFSMVCYTLSIYLHT